MQQRDSWDTPSAWLPCCAWSVHLAVSVAAVALRPCKEENNCSIASETFSTPQVLRSARRASRPGKLSKQEVDRALRLDRREIGQSANWRIRDRVRHRKVPTIRSRSEKKRPSESRSRSRV